MDVKVMLALRTAGVDTDSALRRFSGNTALYERFLLKFPQDENFGKIGPAFAQGNWGDALTAAHTLKGISGNLGMERLYQACSETVSLLRSDEHERAADSYQEMENAYQQICEALRAGEDG